MPVRKRRSVTLLVNITLLAATFIIVSAVSAKQLSTNTSDEANRQYLPVLFRSSVSAQASTQELINQFRANAGVPAFDYSPLLERNCYEHARYMAENGDFTHEQKSNLPFASSNGQTCARQANLWLGSGQPASPWEAHDAIMDWMSSVAHRAWLLYPTTKVSGFGFYTSTETNRAAAALDILSGADFGTDEAYGSWPVRYPGSGEKNIPATRYPITLNWRYFGPEPVLKSVRLTTANGKAIEHEANTQISAGHKGIQIIPKIAFPKQSNIIVTVTGQYDGAPFSYSWQFYTGSIQNVPSAEIGD